MWKIEHVGPYSGRPDRVGPANASREQRRRESCLGVGMRTVPLPRRVLVRGPSMSPALADGDVVLAWGLLAPRAGDMALVRWAARPGQLSIKRLREPVRSGWDVRGDFAEASTDSRTLGAAQVVAVVVARLYPSPRRLRR